MIVYYLWFIEERYVNFISFWPLFFYSYVAGVVINTCGWVRGEGYNQIKHIAQAFEVQDASFLFLILGNIFCFFTHSTVPIE